MVAEAIYLSSDEGRSRPTHERLCPFTKRRPKIVLRLHVLEAGESHLLWVRMHVRSPERDDGPSLGFSVSFVLQADSLAQEEVDQPSSDNQSDPGRGDRGDPANHRGVKGPCPKLGNSSLGRLRDEQLPQVGKHVWHAGLDA